MVQAVEIPGCHHCHQDYARDNLDLMGTIVTMGWMNGNGVHVHCPGESPQLELTMDLERPRYKPKPIHPT
jgi:hypothetical protein